MTTTEVLLAAKAKLDTHGWCQGAGINLAGQFCAMRAIEVAGAGSPSRQVPFDFIPFEIFREACGNPLITVWNDAPKRTLGEVLAMFDKSIAVAQERGL